MFIQEWHLLKDGIYSRVAFTQGWSLFKGGAYSRVELIQGWRLFVYSSGVWLRVAFIQGWHFQGWLVSISCSGVCNEPDELYTLALDNLLCDHLSCPHLQGF